MLFINPYSSGDIIQLRWCHAPHPCSSGDIRQLIWHLSSRHILRDTSAKLPTLRHPEKICLPVPHSYFRVGLTQPNSSFSHSLSKNLKSQHLVSCALDSTSWPFFLVLEPHVSVVEMTLDHIVSPKPLHYKCHSKGHQGITKTIIMDPITPPLARPLQYGSELC